MKSYRTLVEYQDHETIIDLSTLSKTGKLKGFIAIHNSKVGSAVGGTRVFPYMSKVHAIKDVLKLSRAMSYKCAIAGLPFGGGKGVIIADHTSPDFKDILNEYAECVRELNGKFYTGEDVGLTEADVQSMLEISPFFIGKTGLAGDPSNYAALTAYLTMKIAAKEVFGSKKLAGKKIAVKGAGKTGAELVRLLSLEGAEIYVADIDEAKVKRLVKKYKNVFPISVKNVLKANVDIISPCAMGGDFTLTSIKSIKASIIAGTANNQLAHPKVAQKLYKMGIMHVPDYIANAGGLINVADELLPGGYSSERVLRNIRRLEKTCEYVLKESRELKKSPDIIADRLAEIVIAPTRKSRLSKVRKMLVPASITPSHAY